MFWDLYLSRGHSAWEPASTTSRVTTLTYTGTCVSRRYHRENNSREVLEKNKGEWNGEVEFRQEEISGNKRSMHSYILTYSRLSKEYL